jgi:hypothetical protein
MTASKASLAYGLTLPVKRSREKRTKPILNPAQILDIYHDRWKFTQVETAKHYGTSQSIVSRIWNRLAWCSVTDTEAAK